MKKTLAIVLGGSVVFGAFAVAERAGDDADPVMGEKVSTFLMFTGEAEAAMDLYVSLFEGARVVHMKRHENGEGIYHAVFEIDGREFAVSDSPPVHDFTFTPSMSLFVECESDAEIERVHNALVEGGEAIMPMGEYPFAKKFAWVQDRFGVSWQLRLKD